MSVNYRVQVFRTAKAEVPRPEVFWMSGWDEWETLYFYTVVIRNGNIIALINTGPPRDLEILNARWREFAGPRCQLVREPEETLEEILRRAEIAASQITHILLTPLQLYATANISMFPNAKICISRKGWIEDILARPPWLHVPREYCISDATLNYLLIEARERLHLLSEEEEICPGIQASWVGTHHRSSVLYSIATSKGTVGVSDCAFKYGNFEGHPLGIGESIEEGYRAYARIRREVQHFIPLYDPEVLVRYPDGVVA